MATLEWRMMTGSRLLAEAPAGDDAYYVFPLCVAFTCDADFIYDGHWSSDSYAEFDEAAAAARRAVASGLVPYIRPAGPIELYRVRDGRFGCLGDGGGVAVACDWYLYLGESQIGYYASCEEALEAAEEHARVEMGG